MPKSNITRSNNKQCTSAGRFCTSSAGARALLILLLVVICSIITAFNYTDSTFATTSSISLSVADNLSLTVLPTSANGNFATTSTTDNNISVKTDNYTGYTLGIAASSSDVNNNKLVYRDSSNNNAVVGTISSISNVVTATNYADDTYALANDLNNTWGFRPSKYNSQDNTITNNYYPGPNSTTVTVLDSTSSANPSVANNYNIAIGARIDAYQPIGTYENTFVITAVANAIPYTINYNANVGTSGDTVSNMPSTTTSSTYAEDVILAQNRPTRNGYTFLGWCNVPTVTGSDNADTCSDTKYLNNGTYSLDQTTTNTVNLYAMWGPTNQLYYKVMSLAKLDSQENQRMQNLTDTKAVITVPTSSNPATDTSNSGVYLYNEQLFGASSDASNDYNIYYYRGILDSDLDGTVNTYGSNGNGYYYPNYVKLNNDTCWRIVRTTGSGGVKMVYNGSYSIGTTPNSCANVASEAQITSAYFNRGTSNDANYYGTKGFVTYVGYNYNLDYAYNHTEQTGSVANATLFNNTTSSNAKIKIEGWYDGNMTAYTNRLEIGAGYCNDRSTERYSGQEASTVPYAPNTATSFGSRYRLDNDEITLGCPNESNDLLTTSVGLTYPISLLTLDEMQLAGSGFACCSDVALNPATPNGYPSNWAYNSYLRSGSYFWLLSPYNRNSSGVVVVFLAQPIGYSGGGNVNDYFGLRPTISLIHSTIIASGSGTATDPWVINP